MDATFNGIAVEDLIYVRHYNHLRIMMHELPQAKWFAQDEFLANVPKFGRTGGFFLFGYDLNEGEGGGY